LIPEALLNEICSSFRDRIVSLDGKKRFVDSLLMKIKAKFGGIDISSAVYFSSMGG
jgi:hypothetical protein